MKQGNGGEKDSEEQAQGTQGSTNKAHERPRKVNVSVRSEKFFVFRCYARGEILRAGQRGVNQCHGNAITGRSRNEATVFVSGLRQVTAMSQLAFSLAFHRPFA
jgi:hypothetical protein